jgi:uncharacterized membrane protein YvbJ
MGFCTHCGVELDDRSTRFCIKCGNELKFPKKNTDTTNPSKKSGKKNNVWNVLAIGVIIVIGVIMLPSIIGFDEAQNENNFQKKKLECSDNNDLIYTDIFENFCCTSEKYIMFESNGYVCPKQLEFIYP